MAITDNGGQEQFFYLRISGLPYYIFATINPSHSTRYGASAWSAPTDYPATWAQGGLQLPDDEIEQKLTDVIGGVASAGRIRLSVIDFPHPSHPGVGFFARLFAPGRALSDSSVIKAKLNARVTATATTTTLSALGADATFMEDSDVYVGGETIGISDVSGPTSGISTLTIAARNKYVCYGNNSVDSTTAFPAVPYHRIVYGADASAGDGPTISSEPIEVMGRSAALWMGVLDGAGMPQAESQSKCLLLGRIIGLDVGRDGGAFEITVESITADLDKALIAGDLAADSLAPRLYIQNGNFTSFGFMLVSGDTHHSMVLRLSIFPGSYTVDALISAVNTAIAGFSNPFSGDDAEVIENIRNVRLSRTDVEGNGIERFVFSTAFKSWMVRTGSTASGLTPDDIFSGQETTTSLYDVLGFTDIGGNAPAGGQDELSIASHQGAVADQPIPLFFCPTISGATVTLKLANQTSQYFSVIVAGSKKPYVRFGNGTIVELTAEDTGANTITVGGLLFPPKDDHDQLFYRVTSGETPIVEQVIVHSNVTGPPETVAITLMMGRFLASTRSQDFTSFNAYHEGVGLGWLPIMDEDEWNIDDEGIVRRYAIVDRATTFADMFTPLLREHGLFILWDPSDGIVSLRRMQTPQAANSQTFQFTESNRATANDRTAQKIDKTSLRTSWKLSFGWDWREEKFVPPPIVLNSVIARSLYPNDQRQEKVEDKTLAEADFAAGIGKAIAARLVIIGASWTLCRRSLNKTGMLLAPGTIHKIIDATAVNPFTGVYGIVGGDDVYGVLTSVRANPAKGDVEIEYMINSADDQSLIRPWSPVGLVNFALSTGGFTNGYNSSTKTLTMLRNYSRLANDAADFVAGDKVRITVKDNPDTVPYDYTDTIASTTSTTIVLTTGLSGALSTTLDTIVMLQSYSDATSARKTGAHKVSFQGNGITRIIDADAAAPLHHWS